MSTWSGSTPAAFSRAKIGRAHVSSPSTRLFRSRHPLAVLEPGVPADVIDVQVGAHHHVDLVGLDAGCLQPCQDRKSTRLLSLHAPLPLSAPTCRSRAWCSSRRDRRAGGCTSPCRPGRARRRLPSAVPRSEEHTSPLPPRASSALGTHLPFSSLVFQPT